MKRHFHFGPITVALMLAIAALHCGCNRNTSATSVATTAAADSSGERTNAGNESEPSGATKTPLATPSGSEFEPPIRLQAGGEFISVESPGYACPTMADVDGDGKEDLVVGQFKNGNMQFCQNIAAANQPPEFTAAVWIKTGEGRAVVPGVW